MFSHTCSHCIVCSLYNYELTKAACIVGNGVVYCVTCEGLVALCIV